MLFLVPTVISSILVSDNINTLHPGGTITKASPAISGTQAITWIGQLRAVFPSVDVQAFRLAESSLIKLLHNFTLRIDRLIL